MRLIQAAVTDGAICGAVLAAGTGDRPDWTVAVGRQEPAAGSAAMRVDTVFDLASLTKVVATLPAVLTLAARNALRLDDPVSRFLPAFTGTARDRITLRHLLAHTSGLPASRRYYREVSTADQMRAAVLAEHPVTDPGSATVYSDIGFLLLGFVVETVTGRRCDVAADDLVFDPLGMSRTRFNPIPGDPQCAPTEALDGADPLRGVVHDRNALLLGGVAGHAGLFAPVGDLVTYLRAWLPGADPPWGRSLTATALRRQTPPGGPVRGLGWVLADGHGAGFPWDAWPDGGAGHTGFTGTSVAVDPRTSTRVVLLTNAIRCGRDKTGLSALRRSVHQCLAMAMSLP